MCCSMDSVSASRFGVDGSNHGDGIFFSFILKFPEYFQTLFLFSLSFLYAFFLSSQVNARTSDFDLSLITEFDLLLR